MNESMLPKMKTSTARKLGNGLFLALSCFLSLDSAQAHSPSFSEGLVQAQDPATKKWGYLNKKGEWALPPKVDAAYEFKSGRALIKQGDQTLCINQSGKVAFICKWKVELWEGFHGGLLRIVEDGKHGFIDTNGKLCIEPEYDEAENFSDGLAAVSMDGKWGFVDAGGKVVVPLEWDSVGSFREGFASVSREHKTGFINKSGVLVMPLQYSKVKDFQNGIALVFDAAERKWGVINAKGEVLTPPKWKNYPRVIGDGRIIFQDGDIEKSKGRVLWGLADSKGNVIVEPKWTRVGTGGGFDSGLAVAILPGTNDENWYNGMGGYIDRNGTAVIPYKFDYTNWFQDGLAFASEGDMKGYIDTSGNFLFELPE